VAHHRRTRGSCGQLGTQALLLTSPLLPLSLQSLSVIALLSTPAWCQAGVPMPRPSHGACTLLTPPPSGGLSSPFSHSQPDPLSPFPLHSLVPTPQHLRAGPGPSCLTSAMKGGPMHPCTSKRGDWGGYRGAGGYRGRAATRGCCAATWRSPGCTQAPQRLVHQALGARAGFQAGQCLARAAHPSPQPGQVRMQ